MTLQEKLTTILAEADKATPTPLQNLKGSPAWKVNNSINYVPALAKALLVAVEAMSPCNCDNQHTYTCLQCEVVPEIEELLK